MKKFELVWKDGQKEIVQGETISDAFNRAGYGAGAIRALDSYNNLGPVIDTKTTKK